MVSHALQNPTSEPEARNTHTHSGPSRQFPASILFILPPSSNSVVDKGRFCQNGPASQHARKEPTKNKFLVNFCFELTAQHLFSSDLPPSPKSLVDTWKALPIHPQKSLSLKNNSPLSIPLVPTSSSTSLVLRSRFRQNEPASPHVRKEPIKQEFLVDYRFELTA